MGTQTNKKVKRFGISLLKEKYFTQSDIFKRGWTLLEIRTILPEPILFENPTNVKFPPIKCWKKRIVEEKEKSKREK